MSRAHIHQLTQAGRGPTVRRFSTPLAVALVATGFAAASIAGASGSAAATPKPCDGSKVANLTSARVDAQRNLDDAGRSLNTKQAILDALPSGSTRLLVPNFAEVPVQTVSVPGVNSGTIRSISDLIRPLGTNVIVHGNGREYVGGQVLDAELALLALKDSVRKGKIGSKDASRVIAGLLR